MQAIIVTGGKQYKVAQGDTLFIEKLEAEAGAEITFDQVLAILNEDKATFGAPTVEDVYKRQMPFWAGVQRSALQP